MWGDRNEDLPPDWYDEPEETEPDYDSMRTDEEEREA